MSQVRVISQTPVRMEALLTERQCHLGFSVCLAVKKGGCGQDWPPYRGKSKWPWAPLKSVALTLIALLTTMQSAQAQTLSVLYAFKGGSTGNAPVAALVIDSAKNLYGTTQYGGNTSGSGFGVVFKLDANNDETVLYRFGGGADGWYPKAALVRDAEGNLYGTTMNGGAFQHGTVFRLDSGAKKTVLHSFSGGADGWSPVAPLIMDAAGDLYGTTLGSGLISPSGVVFKLDASGKETVLHTFTGKADGGSPVTGLIQDSTGNLYGATEYGGAHGVGTVFKIDAAGNETVLHSFSQASDGAWPVASLIRDAVGNLYGTTSYGNSKTYGVVFEINTTGQLIAHDVFTQASKGVWPKAGLVRDAEGNLYGTTESGGTHNFGVVFKLDPLGNETVLHSFTGGADGRFPVAGLLLDARGDLYETTVQGGDMSCSGGSGFGCGVIFSRRPISASSSPSTGR
jgi:uncharacterized repeat protein (TIGR03803 family)